MVGHLVWAKLRQHWWPARIASTNEIGDLEAPKEKKLPNSILVYLFGTHSLSWAKEEDIKDYSTEHMDQELQWSVQQDYFKMALKEIEDYKEERISAHYKKQIKPVIRNNNSQQTSSTQHRQNRQQQQQLDDEYKNGADQDDEDSQMTICDDEDEVDRHSSSIGSSQSQLNNNQYKKRSSIDMIDRDDEDEQDEDEDEDSQLLTRMKRGRGEEDHQSFRPIQQHNTTIVTNTPNTLGIMKKQIPATIDEDDHSDDVSHNNGFQHHHHQNQHQSHQSQQHMILLDQEDEDRSHPEPQPQPTKKKRLSISIHEDEHYNDIEQQNMHQQDDGSSPQLGSRRSLLIKPPRSPLVTNQPSSSIQQQQQQQRTRPVVVANTQNNSSTITCISKPPTTSPTVRSATAAAPPPHSPNINVSVNSGGSKLVPASPPILASKLPQSMVNALLQKKGLQQSPSLSPKLGTVGGTSPGVHPKTPITLSIPRIGAKKPATVGASPTPGAQYTTASPSITPANSQQQPIASPFHLPQQYRKNVFPPSPSLRVTPNMGAMRFPQSPLLPVMTPIGMPVMTPPLHSASNNNHNNNDKPSIEDDSTSTASNGQPQQSTTSQQQQQQLNVPQQPQHPTHINSNGTPILAQGYPMVPFLSIPPFSLNSSVNLETIFNSPFNGKLSVRGGLDVGFHIDCTIMGKTFQGYLTEAIAPPPTGLAPPIPNMGVPMNIPPNLMQPKQQPPQFSIPAIPSSANPPNQLRNNEPMPMYDYHFLETYRQWQEMMIKNQMQRFQQHQNNTNLAKQSIPSPTTSPTTNTTTSTSPPSSSSTNNSSTKQDEQSNGKDHSHEMLPPSSNVNDDKPPTIVLPSSTEVSPNLAENSQFLQFKQNAFQKLEQYQKVQLTTLLSKYEENQTSLQDAFDKEKSALDQGSDKLATIEQRFKEDNEKLVLAHKDQRAKLDATHSYQASKFHREVEKQWSIQQSKLHLGHDHSRVGGIPSPLGSPTLTPFISPSPSPSPSLSSFLDATNHSIHNAMNGGVASPLMSSTFALLKPSSNNSNPTITNNNSSKPFMLNNIPPTTTTTANLTNSSIKSTTPTSSTSLSSSSNSTPSTSSSNSQQLESSSSLVSDTNSSIGTLTQSKDGVEGAQPPPLSLSSNSPPRSPNEMAGGNGSSNNTSSSGKPTIPPKSLPSDFITEKDQQPSSKDTQNNNNKESIKSSSQPNLSISIES